MILFTVDAKCQYDEHREQKRDNHIRDLIVTVLSEMFNRTLNLYTRERLTPSTSLSNSKLISVNIDGAYQKRKCQAIPATQKIKLDLEKEKGVVGMSVDRKPKTKIDKIPATITLNYEM